MTYRPRPFTAPLSLHATYLSASRESIRERRLATGLFLLTVVVTVVLAVVPIVRPAQAAEATETEMVLASHEEDEAIAAVPDASARGLTEAPRVWPWWRWYRMGVSPQFAYRQVVETGRRRGRQAQQFEIRTRYRYVPRRVSRHVADVDVLITGIDVYQRGRFLGSIERIPPRIRRTRARIFRNRPARIDRKIAVIGGGGYGYELLALRPGQVWQRPAVLAAARVNLRQGAAIPVRRSTLISSRRPRYVAPVPLLPSELGRISPRLLRFDVSYYDVSYYDESFGRSGHRYDHRYDPYDDRFELRRNDGFDARFNDESPNRFESRDRPLEAPYDGRYDRKKSEVNPPRPVPRSLPQDRRLPYRQGALPTTQSAETGRSPEKASAQNRGSRAPAQAVDARPSVPRPDARTARNAPPTIVSRSANTRLTTGRGSERSASVTRRIPDTITGRDTRTVGDGDDAVTIKRETEIVRLDDYELEDYEE